MLFLDGAYVERYDGSIRLRWVTTTKSNDSLALRIWHYIERLESLGRNRRT